MYIKVKRIKKNRITKINGTEQGKLRNREATKERRRAYLAPMESMVQMKGLSSSPNPAITGWHK